MPALEPEYTQFWYNLTMNVEQVDLSILRQHPENPRIGRTDLIAASIRANGLYQPLVVQKCTGYVLVGNHRLKALQELGEKRAPVVYLDIDDDAARQVLLSDNRTTDLAEYDDRLLVEILCKVENPPIGYDQNEIDLFLREISGVTGQDHPVTGAADRENSLLRKSANPSVNKVFCPKCGADFEIS